MLDMERREFIGLVGGGGLLLVTKVMRARAQQPAMPVIGFLHQGSSQASAQLVVAFGRGLQESGYAEGRNVTFEFRWADGEYDRLPELAADLVTRHVAVIAAALLPAARAAKATTSTIPIVFISGSDPIETGLVMSLSRPTGNVTGVSLFSVPLIEKRLEVLREIIPTAVVVAVLVNPSNPNTEANVRVISAAAQTMRLRIEFINALSERDLEAAFSAIVDLPAGALIVGADGFFASRRERIVALAARHAVPTMYFQREFVAAGGLISYGTSSGEMYREAGTYVGRLLKGAKPADLPVLQPTKFELVINFKTAKALGVDVPPMLLARADEVIE
ncbi:MAG TPA: ABC transporter substrate-binding protein [Stellaceae bacterium]|nr:ABC transporter substrate-binding protein [Stellaceae bacterium]